jgi:alpha-L-fucosidase
VPGVPPRGWRANTWDFPNASNKDVARYLEKKAKPQLREILTQYGPIGSIWFDTPDSINKRQSADLYKLIKSLQPDCLVNNRVGNRFGDYDTPEQKIPKTGLTRPWETCMTINDHWAYVRTNDNWKSTSLLVRCLVDIASKGGNLLLNVGPTGTGEIPAPSVDRLHAIGDWMELHGESIYGTSASSYGTGEDTGIVFSDIQGDGTQEDPSQKIGRHQVDLPHGMRVTEKPGVLYIHLFDHLEDNKLKLNDLPSTVTKATLLSDPKGGELKFIQNGNEFSCQLPQGIWNEHCTVVKLEVTSVK